jgi:hypothetical protein
MPKSLLFTSLLLYTVAMFCWHKLVVLIVTNYGIVGTVIAGSISLLALLRIVISERRCCIREHG